MKDYYDILDVPMTATREEIKAQYKQLVRVYHPDRFRDASDKAYAEEKLKQINIAFQVLCGTPMQPVYEGGIGAPQPVAYPPVLDFGVVRYGEKRSLPLQVGNVGGPVATLQLRCSENNSPFQISQGKPVYADRAFPVNYEVSIDTRHLAPSTAHQTWLEVNLDGVFTRVEVRLQVSPAPQRAVRPQRPPYASPRWLPIALTTLLICVVVAALPAMDSFASFSTLTLPSFFFSRSLHDLQPNNLLFAAGENGAPILYVTGEEVGQPKALGVNGRGAAGSAAGQQVAYLGTDN
ncbi:MAG: J domain-containing protein, partial [Caldilinea sp. CFX5]|nr:J domain-containing protein [Caldilinea sp. CFX5]